MVKFALLSVYDKKDIVLIAQALLRTGYIIAATKGTGASLEKSGIQYIDATKLTKSPNVLTDCLQTYSFNIAGGILFNRHNQSHLREVEQEQIPQIDVVVCNITDTKSIIASLDDFNIKHVDLGGPSMLRAAAINYKDVLVIPAPEYYTEVIDALDNGHVDLNFRKKMAMRTFSITARYDLELEDSLSKLSSLE